MNCKAILKTGKNKGNECKKKCVGEFCARHLKVKNIDKYKDNFLKYNDEVILFSKGWPSNWFPSLFTHNNITYCNVEQYMMYHKAILFNDLEAAALILLEKNPMKIKNIGRGVKNFNVDEWNKGCFSIVYNGNLLKYQQNIELKKLLLKTENKLLAEASKKDKKWGIGLGIDDINANDINKWKGENMLGKVLMKVRDELKMIIN